MRERSNTHNKVRAGTWQAATGAGEQEVRGTKATLIVKYRWLRRLPAFNEAGESGPNWVANRKAIQR